jgi:hypothetical protein
MRREGAYALYETGNFLTGRGPVNPLCTPQRGTEKSLCVVSYF